MPIQPLSDSISGSLRLGRFAETAALGLSTLSAQAASRNWPENYFALRSQGVEATSSKAGSRPTWPIARVG